MNTILNHIKSLALSEAFWGKGARRAGKGLLLLLLLLPTGGAGYAAQTLNNPVGTDGCYIVKWDCATNRFAAANDFEADETFTFAIDITGTQWVNWLAADSNRRLATNFGTTSTGNGIVRDADRLFHIQDNIWGKTLKLSQLGTVNLTVGQQQAIYSNIFGFMADGSDWYMNPSEDVVGKSNCFFRTAPYTGTHTCPDFTTADYAGNPYAWINLGGYAVPCAVASPCYSDNHGGGIQGGGTPNPQDPPLDGSQVYPFPTDAQQIGYYNRPYERYEAEPGWCTTNGQFLAANDDQRNVQSEASHQQALQLIHTGDSVSWVVNRPGDGLTIRFSLPDSEAGTGMVGYLDVYAGSDKVGTLYLNSYWAWQYCDGNYPDNRPRTGNVVIRMRFDENHLRLSRMVQSGEVLTLRKNDRNDIPYTVDFIELEPVPAKVTYESLSGDKVQYDPATSGLLSDFIRNNGGKTIYLPEGTIDCPKRIYLNTNDTKIIGAGMWYTQIYFSASSDDAETYSKRGFEAIGSNLKVEGIYLNTANNKRYYNNDDSKQVGKGFQGSWGKNSTIRNCWVEHFECGAWIADYNGNGSENLLFEHCRIRNNYADGINFSQYTKNHTARYCSFRNNGDDDMASWTSSGRLCSGMVYAYCTAENNWRASSLGFFGGKNLTGHHLHIVDGLESGLRVNADFPGGGFATDGQIYIHDVTVEHCGCQSGTRGQKGDFWGSYQPAVSVGAGNNYDIRNVTLENLTVRNSRSIAVNVRAGNKKVYDTKLIRLHVDGATTAFQCTNGGNVFNTTYCELRSENVNNHMVGCGSWQQLSDCLTGTPETFSHPSSGGEIVKQLVNGQLVICVAGQRFDAQGRKIDD